MEKTGKHMEKSATVREVRRLIAWLEQVPVVPLVFAETDFRGLLHTEPQALLEWILVERGSFTLEVGTERETLRTGDIAWVNAHHGNHADLAGNDAVYACLSLDVGAAAAVRALGRKPLVRVFRGPSLTWSSDAFREVVRWHRAEDEEVRGAMLRAGLVRLLGHLAPRGSDGEGAADESRLERARRLMNERSEDPALAVADVARTVGVSLSTLRRMFSAQLGTTPMAYLQSLRLNRARDLLAKTGLEVKEVAARVGYADALYFSKAFRRAHGQSPSRFAGRRASHPDEQSPRCRSERGRA